MLRSKLLKLTLSVILGGGALLIACGPLFPPGMLNRGADALLAAPVRYFQLTLTDLSPPTSPKAVPPSDDETPATQRLRSELAQLTRAGADEALLARYREFRTRLDDTAAERSPPAVPAGLPPEFRLYLAGVLALRSDDPAAAADQFAALLALPPEQRRLKSVAAAYMLGVLDHRDADRQEPSPRFAQTRELSAAGFEDPDGLAAASFGQEARFHYLHQDYVPAIHLYLRQHASGDPTAAGSLSRCARGILQTTDAWVLTDAAADPVVRRLVSSRLLQFDFTGYHAEQNRATARRWINTLLRADMHEQAEATTLALLAYETGDHALAADACKVAPADDVTNRWIRAKLALRDGDVATAAGLLADLVRDPALDDYFVDQPDGRSAVRGPDAVAGELATLRLAGSDFNEALGLFLAGDWWEDAAYVAERILRVDELQAFLRTDPTGVSDENMARLRHLLARRLFRAGRLDEARTWFPPVVQIQSDRHRAALARGRDAALPAADRAAALMSAARLLREHGLELAGTELAPDHAIWDGDFEAGITIEQRIALAGPATPGAEEIARANHSEPEPALRFHYRHRAADLAWEASQLMPDNSPELVATLMEAGGWLKGRTPQAADRFYKALVTRCPKTETGRSALALHWFPALATE